MNNNINDSKLASATLALLRRGRAMPTRWLPEMSLVPDEDFVARLARTSKPVLCLGLLSAGTLTFACWEKADGSVSNVLADFGEGTHHVEFGDPGNPVVLSPKEFQSWLEQYDVVHELAFSEVQRADGTRLFARLFADDGPSNDLHTMSEWPIADA